MSWAEGSKRIDSIHEFANHGLWLKEETNLVILNHVIHSNSNAGHFYKDIYQKMTMDGAWPPRNFGKHPV